MKTLIALAVSGLLASGMAVAEVNKADERDNLSAKNKFALLDENGNMNLTPAEVSDTPEVAENFVTADTDQNGELSEEEFVNWYEAQQGDRRYSSSEIEEEVDEATDEINEERDEGIEEIQDEAGEDY